MPTSSRQRDSSYVVWCTEDVNSYLWGSWGTRRMEVDTAGGPRGGSGRDPDGDNSETIVEIWTRPDQWQLRTQLKDGFQDSSQRWGREDVSREGWFLYSSVEQLKILGLILNETRRTKSALNFYANSKILTKQYVTGSLLNTSVTKGRGGGRRATNRSRPTYVPLPNEDDRHVSVPLYETHTCVGSSRDKSHCWRMKPCVPRSVPLTFNTLRSQFLTPYYPLSFPVWRLKSDLDFTLTPLGPTNR